MDPTELFIYNNLNECGRHAERSWKFFFKAFYLKPAYIKWVENDSLWDFYLKYGDIHPTEMNALIEARRKILDDYKDLCDTFLKKYF